MVQKGLQATKRGILRASEGSDSAFGSFVEATEGRRPAGEGAKLGAAYLPAEDPRYPGLRLNPYRNHSFFQRSPTLMRRQEGKRLYYEAVAAGGHPDDGGGGAGGTTNGPFGRGAEVKTGKARRHPPRTPHRSRGYTNAALWATAHGTPAVVAGVAMGFAGFVVARGFAACGCGCGRMIGAARAMARLAVLLAHSSSHGSQRGMRRVK